MAKSKEKPALDVYMENVREARAALRMIREALEIHCPPGTIPAGEHIEPTPFTAEAEVLVKRILVLAKPDLAKVINATAAKRPSGRALEKIYGALSPAGVKLLYAILRDGPPYSRSL